MEATSREVGLTVLEIGVRVEEELEPPLNLVRSPFCRIYRKTPPRKTPGSQIISFSPRECSRVEAPPA